jgi:hypothetical protein
MQTAPLISTEYTQDDLPSSGVSRATFQQALTDLAGASIIRSGDLFIARRGSHESTPVYQPEEARQYMADIGIAEHFTFERPYNERELEILAERKQAELKRAYILQRADGGLLQGAGQFGIQIATSFLDPLTVASAFIPVVGPSRYAAMIAKAGSAAGRAGVRAGVGAAEGAFGAAILEPIIYSAKQYEQADYDLADSMLNIALGGVFGGGLHVAGGALLDVGRSRRRAEADARVAAIRTAIAEQEALAAPVPFTALEAVERRITVADVEARMGDLYQARRRDLEAAVKAASDQPGALGMSARQAAQRELDKLDGAWGRAKNAADRTRVLQGEDGPLWQSLAEAERAENLTAIEARIAELEVARMEAYGRLRMAQADMPTCVLAAEGEKFRQTAMRDANRDLRAIDGELFKLRPLQEKLSESLSSSAQMTVLRAAPAEREAALRAAVAQAVTDQPIEVRPAFNRADMQVAAENLSNPDARSMTNPAAVLRADAVLAQGDRADLRAIEAQSAELDAQIKAMQDEARMMGDEARADEIAEQLAEIAEIARLSRESVSHANMLVVCSARHAA